MGSKSKGRAFAGVVCGGLLEGGSHNRPVQEFNLGRNVLWLIRIMLPLVNWSPCRLLDARNGSVRFRIKMSVAFPLLEDAVSFGSKCFLYNNHGCLPTSSAYAEASGSGSARVSVDFE